MVENCLHRAAETGPVFFFGHISVQPKTARRLDKFCQLVHGEHQDMNFRMITFDDCGCIEPIHHRHAHIHNHQVRMELFGLLDREISSDNYTVVSVAIRKNNPYSELKALMKIEHTSFAMDKETNKIRARWRREPSEGP